MLVIAGPNESTWSEAQVLPRVHIAFDVDCAKGGKECT